ncbi:hypothetical protein ACF1GT_25720 [Streptomyces sp. NPDC014636]|uniref:hypothetical protein n=1 Tax=Streptomyces sp. NPDC014636 TaxID=3364876 RepID=UPI0037012C17
MSWYRFAVEYVDARWPQLGGNSRKNIAKTLTATTIALLRAKPTQFAPAAVRTALREWAFNTNRRPDAPRDVVAILKWVRRNSLPVSAWEDPEKVDQVLHAIDTRLDGKQAAAWSRKRNRRILNVAMKYAIRRRILRANPLPTGKESTAVTKTTNAVDKRSLLNAEQAADPRLDPAPAAGRQAAPCLLRHAVLLRSPARGSRSHAGGGRDPA